MTDIEQARELLSSEQREKSRIPRWENAPGWAMWLQFCSTRGWAFCTQRPHIFKDGHMTSHGHRFVLACNVSGMKFRPNPKLYSGEGRPYKHMDSTFAIITPPRELRAPPPKESE